MGVSFTEYLVRYRINKAKEILLEKNISHDFITRPGGHNGQYWNNSIDYQILFFDKFFKK